MSYELLQGDARNLPLEDNTVACAVFSPPYNVGFDYDNGYEDRLDKLNALLDFEKDWANHA